MWGCVKVKSKHTVSVPWTVPEATISAGAPHDSVVIQNSYAADTVAMPREKA